MKKIISYRFLGWAIAFLLLFQAGISNAQWTFDIDVTVRKEETKKRLEGATIIVKRNGATWKTVTVPTNGKVEISLLPDANYLIEFSKPGHVTKKIGVTLKDNIPAEDSKYGFGESFEISLFEEMDDLDVSILNKPIAKYKFDPATAYMAFDPDYTKTIQKELERLKKELAERLKAEEANRKANQKTYDAAIASADKAYNLKKWAEAKPFYEKAAKIFPKEAYPGLQLADISDKLAEFAEANKRYLLSIERGDKAFAAKEWDKAALNYKTASELKEDEQYPKTKLKEIETILANEKKVAKDYNAAIVAADGFFNSKEYDKSKASYQKALDLKSYEDYPKERMAEIDKLLAELAKKDADYKKEIAEADGFFKSKEYDKAIALYNSALTLKPVENYPKQQIEESNRLKLEQQQLDEDYKRFLAKGDQFFTDKNYQESQSNFEQALALKSEEKYPKDKLAEIKSILAANAENDKKYDAAIKSGDAAMTSKEYKEAKEQFELAKGLKEEEQYPKDKLKEIEQFLAEIAKAEAEQKALDEKYNNLISQADNFLGSKNYEEAKLKYIAASETKTEEQYPKDKLAEIEAIFSAEAKIEADYLAAIKIGDDAFSAKIYNEAKKGYEKALTIKAQEKYPSDKLKEIEVALAELEKKKAEELAQKKLDEEYNALITKADNSLASKKYEDAKGSYTSALALKSAEQYPKDKIKEIEGILAEIAKKAAEEEIRISTQKELDEKYNALITQADNSMSAKNYEDAKGKYTSALGLKAEEQYPKDKIKEIENILAEIARKKAEEEAAKMADADRDKKYNEVITLADNAVKFENYDQALLKYNEALGVKPDEQYPKDKIKEVEKLKAELEEKNAEAKLAAEAAKKKKEYYDALIAQADEELSGKNYEEATKTYNNAIGVMPEEQYPKTKIKEIEAILAKIKADKENANLAQKELEEKYNNLIAAGDASFSSKDYTTAKTKYTGALGIKPAEYYPKDRLSEIERILAEIASKEEEIRISGNAEKLKKDQYDSYIKNGNDEFASKRYQKALTNYKSALNLMPNEQFPKDKIIEIKKILADLALNEKDAKNAALAEKEKRKQYNDLIYEADRDFKLKKYTDAKFNYMNALNLYSEEIYPKSKLKDIEELLKNQNEVKEVIVSNNNSGSRAKINDKKEREIEAMIAKLRNKKNIDKDIALAAEVKAINESEEIRVSSSIDKTNKADAELSKLEDQVMKQEEDGNKRHVQNSVALDEFTEEINEAESKRVSKADDNRQIVKEDLIVQNKETLLYKENNEVSYQQKLEDQNVFVSEVHEKELVIIEKADDKRANNSKDLKELYDNMEENKKINYDKSVARELKVKEYERELTEQEEIRISSSLKRIDDNIDELEELADKRNELKTEKEKSYRINVEAMLKQKEAIENIESIRVENADKMRESNREELDNMAKQISAEINKQDARYYRNVPKIKEYEDYLTQQENELREVSDKKRMKEKQVFEENKAKLGVATQSQKEKFLEFDKKLAEERKRNDDFNSDLVAIADEKRILANADLSNFYEPEKKLENNLSQLDKSYPQGITEEIVEQGNSVTIKRVKVTGEHADVYERIFYTWGGTYYVKNGVNITQALWDKESID
jgi:hypothetical protein